MKTLYIGDPENPNIIPSCWEKFCMHCVTTALHDGSSYFESIMEDILNEYDATLIVYNTRQGYQVRFKTEAGFALFALKWT